MVRFHRATVHFANGSSQSIEMRRVIPAGSSSRVVDLVGDERIVTRVERWYDTQSLGGEAVVKLFGRRQRPDTDRRPERGSADAAP